MFQRRALGIVRAAVALLMGCGGADEVGELGEETDSGHESEALHWSYDGEAGPERWGELGSEFAACAVGEQQSPIDIPSAIAPGPLRALRFDYAPAPATIMNNGHTVQVALAEGASELTIDGEPYSLLQFHFHAHSEHAVGGRHAPLEMHLVHRAAHGGLAVIGVFLEPGAAHLALSPVFDRMSVVGAEPESLPADLDPAELLPTSTDGWAYSGSLTTPPCTEGVKWHLLSSVVEISDTQLGHFTAKHESSRRPLMVNTSPITSGN